MADKQKALETALAQIEKKYGKGAVMRLGENNTMNIGESKEDVVSKVIR